MTTPPKTTLATPIIITILVTSLAILIGIPVWHYATACLLSATWRHRQTPLLAPLNFNPHGDQAVPALPAHTN